MQTYKVGVFNYNTVGEVNGPVKSADLCAYIPNPDIPSQLAVGVCGSPLSQYG